ncbi:unnamed protein product [Clonostachys rhizophaga]|uniref:Uncharacterized protein n=1 Tax=Clonostachys rhizophaga TaxID=160324 RepID=A0A9N9VC40_9HYPO|nr:unnamed protein product [Clonostachys rhizophaga]
MVRRQSWNLAAADTLTAIWVGINDEPPIDTSLQRYLELLKISYTNGLRRFILFTLPRKSCCPRLRNESPFNTWPEEAQDLLRSYNTGVWRILEELKTCKHERERPGLRHRSGVPKGAREPGDVWCPNATCFDSNGVSCLWAEYYFYPGVAI